MIGWRQYHIFHIKQKDLPGKQKKSRAGSKPAFCLLFSTTECDSSAVALQSILPSQNTILMLWKRKQNEKRNQEWESTNILWHEMWYGEKAAAPCRHWVMQPPPLWITWIKCNPSLYKEHTVLLNSTAYGPSLQIYPAHHNDFASL